MVQFVPFKHESTITITTTISSKNRAAHGKKEFAQSDSRQKEILSILPGAAQGKEAFCYELFSSLRENDLRCKLK
jgi:hypothetical protein